MSQYYVKMTFSKAVKPADITVSKYDKTVSLLFKSKDKNADIELNITCKLSYAIEHYSLTDRIIIDTPHGVKSLAFCGYSFISDERDNENFNGFQALPCGGTSGV